MISPSSRWLDGKRLITIITPRSAPRSLNFLSGRNCMKTHIFIDFWNFQLGVNNVATSTYRADWQKISPWLISQASAAVGRSLIYEGTHVYMSYSPNSKKDASLKDFATNVLSRFPGMQVSLVECKAQSARPALHATNPLIIVRIAAVQSPAWWKKAWIPPLLPIW